MDAEESSAEASKKAICPREAKEVILLIPGDARETNYMQAIWFLEHINECISVDPLKDVSSNKYELCHLFDFHMCFGIMMHLLFIYSELR